MIRLLLGHGAQVNDRDNTGATALHKAASRSSTDTEQLPLEHGAQVNDRDNNGATALHIAASKNLAQLATLLLEHQAQANARDTEGQTALVVAACKNSHSIVRVLLASRDIDVTMRGKDGLDALVWARKKGHNLVADEIAAFIAKSGAVGTPDGN